jgi:hypothetical protein
MTETNFRALCAELVQDIEEWIAAVDHCPPSSSALVQRARAALAQPEPVAPTDEELNELKHDYWWLDANHSKPWIPFARAVLARWGNYPVKPDSSPVNNTRGTH